MFVAAQIRDLRNYSDTFAHFVVFPEYQHPALSAEVISYSFSVCDHPR